MTYRPWRPLVVLTCLVWMASGCGKQRTSTDSPASQPSARREVSVAAASDLKFALDEIIAAFRRKHADIEVMAVYGSSGNFFAQLSSEAPFDLFLSADVEYPQRLIDRGLAVGPSPFPYAVGKIVIWVPNNSRLDVAAHGIKSLLAPSVHKIAIANPTHAPYGRAAEAAIKQLGVYDEVKSRLVLAENIAQAAQFVESGAADVGIIAMSIAVAPTMRHKGRYWEIPDDAYPRMEQGGVILRWAKNKNAAETLRGFLLGPAGQAVLKEHGFSLPEN